jgi:hypothetical protein
MIGNDVTPVLKIVLNVAVDRRSRLRGIVFRFNLRKKITLIDNYA